MNHFFQDIGNKYMNIYIIANFTCLPTENGNCRFNYLANMLSKKDEVTLITSTFSHATKKQRETQNYNTSYHIKQIYEPGYKKNISIKRFYSHYVWGKNVKKYIRQQKPDVVYCAIPSLTAAKKIIPICKKNKIKIVIDIQDLWPEAFKMAFSVPIISDLLFLPFTITANYVYKNADRICAVSRTYAEYAIRKNKNKKGYVAYLGTDISKFDNYANEYSSIVKKKKSNNTVIEIRNSFNKLSKSPDEVWMAYCGTLGKSYNLKNTIKAISINKENVRLIIMGDGPDYESLIELAKNVNAKTIFTGRIPYPKMCGILKNCNISINPINKKSVASIINKHADYMSAGLPIINTQNTDEIKSLIKEYEIGINCENDDPQTISDGITELLNTKRLNTMSSNARKCAEELFNRNTSYENLIKAIKE